VLAAYMNHWKTTSAKRKWAKIDIDRKRALCIEKDCLEKSLNYCNTGDRTAELNIHFEDPVSTKAAQHELHRSNIHGWAAIAKCLISDNDAQMHKRWCHSHKTWTSDNWKCARYVVNDLSFMSLT
jgi:hypothetical protein